MSSLYLPVMQVRNSEVIVYNQWQGTPSNHKRNLIGFNQPQYTGNITNHSRKNLQKALSILIQITPLRWIYNPVSAKNILFKLNFVTLTLPPDRLLTAKEVSKNCLEPTLRRMRTLGMKHYVWKAELQQSGQVHYHIATDNFIHYAELNRVWNQHAKKAGYLDGYARRQGHFLPNSTDVHAVAKLGDVEGYMAKYLMKGVGGAGTKGKIWDCNTELKNAKYFTVECDQDNIDLCQKFKVSEWAGEYAYIARMKPGQAWKVMKPWQQNLYGQYIQSLR